MVILKKIKASTLMETLVATVLVVVVFMVASVILNNLFSNSIKNNTKEVDAQLNELQYLYKNDKIKLPYQEEFKDWKITVESFKKGEGRIVEFEATNSNSNQSITKQFHEVE